MLNKVSILYRYLQLYQSCCSLELQFICRYGHHY